MKNTLPPNDSLNSQGKDKHLLLDFIIQTIEKKTAKGIKELRSELSEDKFFYECLKHVTTTKKAICEAIGVPIEAGCRYKRTFEKDGLLVQSKDDFICPYTRHVAKLISTNPTEFEWLMKSKKDDQLKLF